MFISNEEANNRVSSLDNLINKLELRKTHNGGRPKGRKNDSIEKRLEIATTAIEKGCVAAAEEHNTTPSRASLLSNGIITHGNGSDEELGNKVLEKKQSIHDKALDIITQSLLGLEGKLGEVKKPTELAAIAVEMAKVAEKTGGKLAQKNEDSKPNVQVVIYAPRMKAENEYETIDI